MNKDNVTSLPGAANEQPAQQPVETFTFPAPLVQEVVNILGGLPWGQVHNTMNAVMQTVQQQQAARKG